MPSATRILIGVVSVIVAVAAAVGGALLVERNSGSGTAPAPAPVVTAPPAEPSIGTVGIAELRPDTVLVVHETEQARTDFDRGLLWISVPHDSGVFRWIEGAAVVDGGRGTSTSAPLDLLPAGITVVVSYDTADGPVSLYGQLGSTIDQTETDTRYPVTVYDAPGKGSTYTLAGNYDIPEMLTGVRVVLTGQAAAD
jgi:hypothetical protein